MDAELQRLRFRIRQLEREVRALRSMATDPDTLARLEAAAQRAGRPDRPTRPARRGGHMDPDVEGAAV